MSCINLPTVLPGSPSKTRGQIQVILGPMFSGKSTELMRRVRRFQIAQYKCLVIKYAKDTRYSSSFSTHDRNTMEALPACLLRDVAQEALGVAVIGIDEGQFRETEHERGRGRERGRHSIGSRLQAPSHQPRARRGAGTHGPRDRDLAEVGRLTDCATQAPLDVYF
uniref:Thymidine kinase n=1 Tax=Felis catus TaxID=9685 RepID=A0ABI7ZW42_FELCA